MSLPVPSSCCCVRNSCSVPWLRSSYWMPVSARSSRRQSRLYSASRTMRALFNAYRASVQLRSIEAPQRHIAGSSIGQMTSGLWCISIHLTALSGTPGPAQGAEYPGETSPAFAKLVSIAGALWRSSTVTWWPALAR